MMRADGAFSESKLFPRLSESHLSGLKDMPSGRQYEMDVGGRKVMGAGDDEPGLARPQADTRIAAEPVEQKNGVIGSRPGPGRVNS